MKFNLILAKTQSNGIGYQGGLPWKLRKELAYFQRMTKTVCDPAKQNAVIMGRVTWEESMPDAFKPLAGRLNFVLSSKEMPNLHPEAIHCFSIQELISKLTTSPLSDKIETGWVIGGAKLYETIIAANLCHRIYLTEIMADFPCDTFVNIDVGKGFRPINDPAVPSDIQEENGVKYVFKVYEAVPDVWVVLPDLYPPFDRPVPYVILFVIGHFLLVNILGNLLGAVAVDTSVKGRIMPAVDSPDAAGYCDLCCCCTPPRAFHCPTCAICILRRDHHCAFTGCCIGIFNYRYFLMFLLHMFCATMLCLPFNVMFTWDFCTAANLFAIVKVIFPVIMVFYGTGFNKEQGYLILCAISLAAMVFIGMWFYYHFSLALSGKVVHEHRHNIGLYDQGGVENLKQVLGEKWYLVWLLPFVKSDLTGDGVKYSKKAHAS